MKHQIDRIPLATAGLDLFSSFMHGAISEDGALLFRRIVRVSSIEPHQFLLKLRTVSKEFSHDRDLLRLLSSFSSLVLTMQSAKILENSKLWVSCDFVRLCYSDITFEQFIHLMESRINLGGDKLKRVDFFSNERNVFGQSFASFERLSLVYLFRYFGAIEKITWNSKRSFLVGDLPSEVSNFDYYLGIISKYKHIQVSRELGWKSEAYIKRISRSVETLSVPTISFGNPNLVTAYVCVLRNCTALVSLEVGVNDLFLTAIQSLSDKELIACFGNLKSLTFSRDHHVDDEKMCLEALKRLLMAPEDLLNVNFGRFSLAYLMSSYSDTELKSIFKSVRYFDSKNVRPEIFARILVSTNSLRKLSVLCIDLFSREVVNLQADERRRIFREMKRLPLDNCLMPSEDIMMDVLTSMPSLLELNLPMSKKLSEIIMDLCEEQMSKLFGKLRQLKIDDFGMTQDALFKIMRFTKNLNILTINNQNQDDDKAHSNVMLRLIQSSTDEELSRLFGSLQSIYMQKIDFSNNFEELRRFLEAVKTVEKVRLEKAQLFCVTEENLIAFSKEALRHFAKLELTFCPPKIRDILREIDEDIYRDRQIEIAANLSDDAYKAFPERAYFIAVVLLVGSVLYGLCKHTSHESI